MNVYTVSLLVHDAGLRGIVRARRLSRVTLRNIHQKLFFTFIYNRRAGGGGRTVPGLRTAPIAGHCGGAMSFSPVSVASNALRLNRAEL